MRRLILPMILLLTCGITLHGQAIHSVHINAVLHKDGSASITQHWDVEVVSGTEWYIPVRNLGEMTVTDLRVTENGQHFISEGTDWDMDRSLQEKAGRCGINVVEDGVELCWGQGNYGQHEWTVTFELTGMVKSLEDYDAILFQFINPGLIALPEKASVTIGNDFEAEWTDDNTRIWGFGYEDDILLKDGKVVAEAPTGLVEDGHMTIMVRFDKGMFSPTDSLDMDYSEMEEKAKEGSYFSMGGIPWQAILFMILLAAPFIIYLIFAAVATITGNKYKKSLFGERKIKGWYRDVPLDGNIFASYYLLKHGKRFAFGTSNNNSIIGAFFLKWVLEGTVKVIPDGKRVNLDFSQESVEFDNEVERSLYDMARNASGGNSVLEKGEFERWSEKNYNKVTGWPKKANDEGWLYLINNKLLSGSKASSAEAQKEMRTVIEFRNFLKDFTLSSERETIDVKLWKNYLVFAQLYGIADKVSSQLQKLFPADMERYARQYGMDYGTLARTIRYNNALTVNSLNRAAAKAAARASAGYGGKASFGGGGGFSGGGFGGGSR